MYYLTSLSVFMCVSLWGAVSAAKSTQPFEPFSSTFSYPQPPLIVAEFTANFMQQKYDTQLRNHITAGLAYFSPSARKVRVDASPGFNNTLEVSFFDFGNASAQGAVINTVLTFPEGALRSQITCSVFTGDAAGFPLFAPDILNATQAAFVGIEHDALHGPLNAWQFPIFFVAQSWGSCLIYMTKITQFPPNVVVTAFVDDNNTLLRYDFSAPGSSLKTFVTTRFFNVVAGPVSPGVFQTDCT